MNRTGPEPSCSTAFLTQGPSPVESLLPSGGSSLLHSSCGLLLSLLPGPDSSFFCAFLGLCLTTHQCLSGLTPPHCVRSPLSLFLAPSIPKRRNLIGPAYHIRPSLGVAGCWLAFEGPFLRLRVPQSLQHCLGKQGICPSVHSTGAIVWVAYPGR